MRILKRWLGIAACLCEVAFVMLSLFLGIAAASAGEAGLNAITRAMLLLWPEGRGRV